LTLDISAQCEGTPIFTTVHSQLLATPYATYDDYTGTTADRCDTQLPTATCSKPALQDQPAPSGYRHPTDTPTIMVDTRLSQINKTHIYMFKYH